jgi:SRSO17 transposase
LELPRKNCWTIAEQVGDGTPAGMHHLLSRACWDADGVRDDLRDYVVEHMGDRDAVLVVDLCRHRDYAEELAAARARCPCGVCVERVSEGLISA